MTERFRSSRTGSVITTDVQTAARMGSEWEPVDKSEKKAAKKSAAKSEK